MESKSSEKECLSLKYDFDTFSTSYPENQNCSSPSYVICKLRMTDHVNQIKPPLFPCNAKAASKSRKREANDGIYLSSISGASSSKLE